MPQTSGSMQSLTRQIVCSMCSSGLVGLEASWAVYSSHYRGSVSRRDYHHEREFYEKRALVLEEGKSADSAAAGIGAHDGCTTSGDLLSGQIDSIVSLKGVMNLVSQTFQTRLQSEKDIQDLKALVGNLTRHFENQYQSARDHILTFARHSRMAWTRLEHISKTLAETARADFRSIPGSSHSEGARE